MTGPPTHAAPPGRRRIFWVLLGLTLLVGVACLAQLTLGVERVSLARAFAAPGVERRILLGLRLPRLVTGLVVGAGLAVAGASFQVLLRNPLADPFVLGVSGGAALGGTLALMSIGLLGSAVGALTLMPAAAFLGALAAMGLAAWMGRRQPGGDRATTTLLTGVVLNTFASAVIMFLKSLAKPHQAQEILLWLMGTLAVEGLETSVLVCALSGVLIGVALLMARARQLNLLALGSEQAELLGVDARALARWVQAAGSLAVGAAVSITGLVGFVGLVVPHLLRLLFGPDLRLILPASALLGAAFLVLADTLSRVLFPALGTEAPVGVITAFVGGPVFLVLLYSRTRRSSRGA